MPSSTRLTGQNKGIRIDGEYLSQLSFANHIVLVANSTSKLQEMLQDIHVFSKRLRSSTSRFVLPSSIYEKAFESIELEPLFEGQKNQGIEEVYFLQNLYSKATSVLRLHKDSEKFKLEEKLRQGDNISPKLFTSCLQYAIINKINWAKQRHQDRRWILIPT